jgi:hypothetical protein
MCIPHARAMKASVSALVSGCTFPTHPCSPSVCFAIPQTALPRRKGQLPDTRKVRPRDLGQTTSMTRITDRAVSLVSLLPRNEQGRLLSWQETTIDEHKGPICTCSRSTPQTLRISSSGFTFPRPFLCLQIWKYFHPDIFCAVIY